MGQQRQAASPHKHPTSLPPPTAACCALPCSALPWPLLSQPVPTLFGCVYLCLTAPMPVCCAPPLGLVLLASLIVLQRVLAPIHLCLAVSDCPFVCVTASSP